MKLYVGNLSYQITEQELSELFSAHGHVVETKIMMDRDTGRPRGFAFVTMGSASEGQAAIDALNGQEQDGRNLTVNEARPMEPRGNSGFGGGKRPSNSGGKRPHGNFRR